MSRVSDPEPEPDPERFSGIRIRPGPKAPNPDPQLCASTARLKRHGNEADFLGVLQKSVRHRFLTLNFEPFRYGLRIRGDIRNRKTTRMPIDTIFFKPLNKSMVIVHYIPGFFFVKLIF
jgi:hypothetical protein